MMRREIVGIYLKLYCWRCRNIIPEKKKKMIECNQQWVRHCKENISEFKDITILTFQNKRPKRKKY